MDTIRRIVGGYEITFGDHNNIQDAKIDGLAGFLIGGRKALFVAYEVRREKL